MEGNDDSFCCRFWRCRQPPTPVAPTGPVSVPPGQRLVVYVEIVGTFSKALFPALRVGYVVVPVDLIGAFSAARDAADMVPSTLYQAVLTEFIEEGHFARHVRRMRLLYAERCHALLEELRSQLGNILEIANGEAGMHLVGLLPPELKDTVISQQAAELGVSAMPLSRCCLKRPAKQGFILGYGATDRPQIRQGVRGLKLALEAKMGCRPFLELAERPNA
jgi:GntR family transcriptional regulator / MocR family aminotransferase